VLIMGIYPDAFLSYMHASIEHLVAQTQTGADVAQLAGN
jgi:hypothetical protein